MTRVRLGISTCPNDTFAFHGILAQEVDTRGLDFEITLLDVQELNHGLRDGRFDIAKVSFHAALHLSDRCVVLPSGAALGFGVGPVLLGSPSFRSPPGAHTRVLCPGADTTANLLYQLFHDGEGSVHQVVFSDIMPALSEGRADLGVCIHEGRFTYADQGLQLIEDLGARFEEETQAPLPLGGILARADLGDDIIDRAQAVIRDSLLLARSQPDAALPTMRQHAQELDDAVISAHVDLYVNDWTVELGSTGRHALSELSRCAAVAGLLPPGSAPLRVWRSGD